MSDADFESRLRVLEDVEEIRRLKARYCAACDADHDPALLGPLFAEDATWEASVTGRAEGRAEIQKLLGAVGTSGRIRRSAHNVFNPIIEVSGDHATGQWRLVMLYTENLEDGGHRFQRIIGRYDERYRRVDGEWLFESLLCTVEENGPYAAETL